MRAVDVRWIRLAVAAGAIVGSALVSSVAVAADEAASTEPPPTTLADVASIDAGADVIIVDPPPDAPFEDIAVIEIVLAETEAIDPDAIESAIVEPAVDSAVSVDEPTVAISSEAMPFLAMETSEPGAHGAEEPGSEHQGGSGGQGGAGDQGNPYRLTFEVIWSDADGKVITALDVVVPPEVLAQFELSANSQTGKGKVTSATCTYPDGDTVLRCEFHNPGHGSGSDGLIIPARPTATYTVTVAWPVEGWTISGADDEDYSARDLCPRGGEGGSGGHESGGHESGGGESGGHESGGHESGGESGGHESGGHESGGESGGHESGGHESGGVLCVHRVLMRQVAAVPPPPPPPPPPPAPLAPEPPAASPAPDFGVIPPVVTSPAETPTAPAPVVQSAAAGPSSLPITGGSISMILLIAGMLVIMGSALAGLTRRTS